MPGLPRLASVLPSPGLWRRGCPASENVLGNLPVPHSLNVPKSLYQSPSGTSGSCSFHSAAEHQRPEFIDQSILLIRIVVGKILLQSSKEIPVASLGFPARCKRARRLPCSCSYRQSGRTAPLDWRDWEPARPLGRACRASRPGAFRRTRPQLETRRLLPSVLAFLAGLASWRETDGFPDWPSSPPQGR